VKPNRNARMQGVRNMLANESLFLPTVDLAIDFLAVAHMHIMPSEVIIVEFAWVPVPLFPISRLTKELANCVRLNNWIYFQSGKCRAEISAIPFISKSARPQLKREYFSKCRRPVTIRKAIENRLKSRNHSFLPTNL
jgi:hypothetical protein